MTKPVPQPSYPVLVEHDAAGFTLHVTELLVTVRAPTFEVAWERLRHRLQEVVDLAESSGIGDQMPLIKARPRFGLRTGKAVRLPMSSLRTKRQARC